MLHQIYQTHHHSLTSCCSWHIDHERQNTNISKLVNVIWDKIKDLNDAEDKNQERKKNNDIKQKKTDLKVKVIIVLDLKRKL